MYIKRHMEKILDNPAYLRGVMAVVGARQTGKSTLIKHLSAAKNHKEITLDRLPVRELAQQDPETFIVRNIPPLYIDEAQYATTLFPYLKIYCDKTKEKGAFYLSGSQRFNMMKNLTESLAGRVGIFELMGLSLREITNTSFSAPFIPTEEYFEARKEDFTQTKYNDIWKIIHKGSFPELYENPELNWESYYDDYVKTYIERDVHQLEGVVDDVKFYQFLRVVAGFSGQLLNIDNFARTVGIKRDTCENWLSILRASNLIYLLPPYHSNYLKRTIKTPKIYFLDTGLMAFLTKWLTADQLESGAMAGAFFETFVFCELLKSFHNNKLDPRNYLYFYHDVDNNEIDFVIHANGVLHPIEVKKTAGPNKKDITAFKQLDKDADNTRGHGGVVCMAEEFLPLDAQNSIIPINYI